MSFLDDLSRTPVVDLDLSRYVPVPPSTPVADVVEAMCAAGRSCACVVDGESLVGIFTQRDVVARVVGRPTTWGRPISEEMISPVRTMRVDQGVADGLAIMNDWWVRSVPVIDNLRVLVGNLSYYTIMESIAGFLLDRAGAAVEQPDAIDGLSFIDFTGLNLRSPVSVSLDDPVNWAAHHMRARAIGSVVVTDDRGNLVGMLTEFDLQMKVAVAHADLSTIAVKDVMTPEPVALAVRSPIAGAIQQMAERGFSHIPLLGESGRPVGITSFRDIAKYFEESLAALA